MAKPLTIGNRFGPPRFLAFLGVAAAGFGFSIALLHNWALAAMCGFDLAAVVFLASCLPLLGTRESRVIREHAQANDANRILLLVVTGVVMAILLIAISKAANKNQYFPRGSKAANTSAAAIEVVVWPEGKDANLAL